MLVYYRNLQVYQVKSFINMNEQSSIVLKWLMFYFILIITQK